MSKVNPPLFGKNVKKAQKVYSDFSFHTYAFTFLTDSTKSGELTIEIKSTNFFKAVAAFEKRHSFVIITSVKEIN